MSKRTTTLPPEATQRAALINGVPPEAIAHGVTEPEVSDLLRGIQGQRDFVLITERHGKRQMRLSAISQVIYDAGLVCGPWFIRCDGQQLPVSEDNAKIIMGRLNLSMEEPKA